MTPSVDIAILVVTYNSARDIDSLLRSIREEGSGMNVRVVVADNESQDDTLTLVGAHDVVAIRTGGNLGYSAGLNLAARAAGDSTAQLILNPDSTVRPGMFRTLFDALLSEGSIGAVIPRIVDGDGDTTRSLRREPSLLRSAGDAVFGGHWPSRPGWLSELVREPSRYERRHDVDWATGAALMIRSDVASDVGAWDESFFLFSEETDYCRRIRASRRTIRYVPEAIVIHHQGGSGASEALVALTLVNKVRYFRKHHGVSAAAALRAVLIAGEFARRSDETHRLARAALLDSALWPSLDPRGSTSLASTSR